MYFLKRHTKKIIPVIMALVLICSICIVGTLSPSATGTGSGLAEWALNAYKSHWKYVYGGSAPGAVDCSGLIYSYCGGARSGSEQLSSAKSSGSVSSGIPRVHGLGLYQPGHVGVYVGNGMAVDARDEESGICYQSVATKSWTKWFKIAAVTYPTTGWIKFNDKYYYYENGQYIVNTSRTIDGKTFKFSSSGESDKTPDNIEAKAEDTVLSLGSKGDEVEKLQKRLADLGYYKDEVTGYFGEATETAYKAFQKNAGLKVNGTADEDGLGVLYSDKAPKADQKKSGEYSAKIGDENDKVTAIQEQLVKLKYFDDECTGYYGERTAAAVKKFQKENELKATGKVDEATADKLFNDDTSKNSTYKSKGAVEVNHVTKKTSKAKPKTLTTASGTLTKSAKSNAETAQKVVSMTNKVSRKALSGESTNKKVTAISVTEEKNTNFVYIMLLVFGIVVFVSLVMLVINTRRKAFYSGTHTKSRKKENMTVRYW